ERRRADAQSLYRRGDRRLGPARRRRARRADHRPVRGRRRRRLLLRLGRGAALLRAAGDPAAAPERPAGRGGGATGVSARRSTVADWALGRGVTLPLAVAGLALALPVLIGGDPYGLRLLTVAGVYALLGIGYQFAFGHAGLLSLAQGAFFGLGAYVAGSLGIRWGVGAAAALPLAILLPVLLAGVIALPVLRLASHYFALATLAVAQATLLVAVNWTEVTGGANGLAGLPGLELLGMRIGRGLPLLAVTWGVVALGAALAWRLGRGRLGLAWQVA